MELSATRFWPVPPRVRLHCDKMSWTPLDYKPPQPEGLGKDGTPSSLNAIGSVMKILGDCWEGVLTARGNVAWVLGLALEDGDRGVTVTMLLNQGPATEAGLQVGDKIIKVGDVSVTNIEALKKQAANRTNSEIIPLTIVRGGENKSLSLRGGERAS